MATLKSVSIIDEYGTQNQVESTFTRVYQVIFSDGTATKFDAETASAGGVAIPAVNSFENSCHVISIDSKRDKADPAVWEVTAMWSSRIDVGSQGSGSGTDPFNLQFSSTGVMYEEPLYGVDFTDPVPADCKYPGTKEAFDPPLIGEYWDSELVISFNVKVLAATLMDEIDANRGSLNHDNVTITIKGQSRTFPAKCLKLVNPTYALDGAGGGVNGWRVTLPMQYRKPYVYPGTGTTYPGWASLLFAKSLYHNAASNPSYDLKLVHNKDDNGKETTTKQFLNALGQVVNAPTDPIVRYRHPTRGWSTMLSGLTTIP